MEKRATLTATVGFWRFKGHENTLAAQGLTHADLTLKSPEVERLARRLARGAQVSNTAGTG